MEFKSEVFILRRFRRLLTLISILFLFAFSSCANYGFYQLLFGEEDVDDRFSGFSDLSGETVLSSSLGLNGKYSFIVVTDVHIGASDVRSSKMNDFLDEISSLFESIDKTKIPRFIVTLGDTADGGHLSEYNDYNSYLEKIRKLAVEKNVVSSTEAFKIYTILGNHDLYNNGWTDWKKTVYPYKSTYYFSLSSGAADYDSLPFSFYFVDTGNGAFGTDQLDAFEKLLKSDPNPKMIFSHYPFYSDNVPFMALEDTTERNYLLSLFAKNNVKALFGGHVHTVFEHGFGSFSQINTSALFKNEAFRLVTVDESTLSVSTKLIGF